MVEARQEAPVSALPEGTALGKYRIVRKISSGGFSIVYLAQDGRGNSVAIKEYMPSSLVERRPGELAPRVKAESPRVYAYGLKSFFEEGRVLSAIAHRNIVRVLDFFRANETVYMVMQYESGRSLQQHILESRSGSKTDLLLSEAFIRRVFNEVLGGLREVHSNRLLHLDIKPANIYLRMNGEPILLDFGAARQTLQRDPGNVHPMYTPGFAPPELYRRDAELGPWTDLYGIGATMYACMTGQAPQEAETRLREDRMAGKLRALATPYSPALAALVERCLQLNSLERPQGVLAVQRILQDAPQTTEPSSWERTAARIARVRGGIASFMEKHDIKWF
jgi:serine/threonine protein kinase